MELQWLPPPPPPWSCQDFCTVVLIDALDIKIHIKSCFEYFSICDFRALSVLAIFRKWHSQFSLLILSSVNCEEYENCTHKFKAYIPCSCRTFRFSSVSNTASLCQRAPHLDLAEFQMASPPNIKVKFTADSTNSAAVKYFNCHFCWPVHTKRLHQHHWNFDGYHRM